MGNLYQSIARHGIFYVIAGAMLFGSGCGGCGIGEKRDAAMEFLASTDPTRDPETGRGLADHNFKTVRDKDIERKKENGHTGVASWLERKADLREDYLDGRRSPPSLGDLLPEWGWSDDDDDKEDKTVGDWLEETWNGLGGIFEGGGSGGSSAPPYVGNEEVLAAVVARYNENKSYVEADPKVKVPHKALIALIATEAGQYIANETPAEEILSPTGAKGDCQFVGSTAHKYDLCDKVVDGKRVYYCQDRDDRGDSTKAMPAMGRLMTDLYNHYEGHAERDRIMLAYSGYNAGTGVVDRALEKTGKGTAATWEDVMNKLTWRDVQKAYDGKGMWGSPFACARKVKEIKDHARRAEGYLILQDPTVAPTTDAIATAPSD